jgi:hypothetical protein
VITILNWIAAGSPVVERACWAIAAAGIIFVYGDLLYEHRAEIAYALAHRLWYRFRTPKHRRPPRPRVAPGRHRLREKV